MVKAKDTKHDVLAKIGNILFVLKEDTVGSFSVL